jgi:hypothetical protein
MGIGCRCGSRIDPSKMPVGPAINYVNAAVDGMPEH